MKWRSLFSQKVVESQYFYTADKKDINAIRYRTRFYRKSNFALFYAEGPLEIPQVLERNLPLREQLKKMGVGELKGEKRAKNGNSSPRLIVLPIRLIASDFLCGFQHAREEDGGAGDAGEHGVPGLPRATPWVPAAATPTTALPHRGYILFRGTSSWIRGLCRHSGK